MARAKKRDMEPCANGCGKKTTVAGRDSATVEAAAKVGQTPMSSGYPTEPGWLATSEGFKRVFLCSLDCHGEWVKKQVEKQKA